MIAKQSVLIGLAAAVVLFLVSCGGEEPEVVIGEEPTGLGSVFKDMRRKVALGEGGWFKFTIDSVEYPTEWGTPVLFSQSEDGRLFQIDIPTEEQKRQDMIKARAGDAAAAIGAKVWQVAIDILNDILALEAGSAHG